jgi:hypothetical protein
MSVVPSKSMKNISNNVKTYASVVLFTSLFALLSLAGAQNSPTPLDVNDVSFLWPVPETKADVDALISLNDQTADGKLLPDELLGRLMEEAKTVGVGDAAKIKLPNEDEFKKPITWKVAGIRFNPSALGSNPAVLQFTGALPGVRLIVQPVTMDGDKVIIHDFAAHVVFDYFLPRPDGKRIPFIPDKVAFAAIINELRGIKTLLQQAGVTTANQELNVHPGFIKKVPGLTDKLRALLKTHLARKRLDVISFMGIPGKFEPWIFFKVTVGQDGSLTRETVSGNFDPKPKSQMLSFVGDKRVDPAPVLNPAAVQQGFGVSTSLLFPADVESHLDDELFPGATLPIPPNLKLRDVADVIANPRRSHTGSTDCVSCHTETTRRNAIPGLASQEGVAFKQPQGISKVAKSVLPNDKWNLRNFGWGFNFKQRIFEPTVTQRAANEASESTDMINNGPLGLSPDSQPVARAELSADSKLPR